MPRYLPPRTLREASVALTPRELEVQALWFEQLLQGPLQTDDGRWVEVIQPGFWEHGAGPDFTRAVVRFSSHSGAAQPDAAGSGDLVIGHVEVHLRPADWTAHGHHTDEAYNDTILHAVWAPSGTKTFFPATADFRRVPQVILSHHLPAPWEELQPICASLLRGPLPGASPGRCSPHLNALPADAVAQVLRAAGWFRLRQKALRWHWRSRLTSPSQALYEALAEALGFHANQIPMRLTAQRLPWSKLRAMDATGRLAHLFGLAGFLPGENALLLREEPRAWVRELWETWWKARSPLDYAQLTKQHWKLASQRPLNRPERRLAALAHLVPRIPDLAAALGRQDEDEFSRLLLSIRDEFWEEHATLSGPPLADPCRLIGQERVHDILINVFWPMVSLDQPEAAQAALEKIRAAPNNASRVATQRLLCASLPARQLREALIQQGLLQIYRDYCQTDCSQCETCTFPELVQSWPGDQAV